MDKIHHINEKWIKASILGTIWASSEIVLGSFLHNLRIPFSGNILTAIALIILISASYKWPENGLFWRAGVICALLKTMSPSAVIFGPMIAIFTESVLLELSVRILGRTIPGYILGAVLAMSWNLFQKIFNFIIFYGYNIVEVYTNLMQYAEKQMHLKFDAVWAPIVLLLILYALFGAFSAIIGIRTGKNILKNPFVNNQFKKSSNSNFEQKQKHIDFRYSLSWLILNIILIAGSLLLIGRINFAVWVLQIVTIALIWALRYKRALRQIARPRLWIFFVLITMLTAFVFSRLQSESTSTLSAILIGVEMNLRAIVLIMGFTVLGTELYNPKIRTYFAKTYFKQLPLALELSLDSLPAMIANTPEVRTILKHPGIVVQHFINYAENRLVEIRQNQNKDRKIYIVTGKIGVGKTSLIKEIISKLKMENLKVEGIVTTRIMENEISTGYDILNVSTNEKARFLRTFGDKVQQRIGKFYIYTEGLELGQNSLKTDDAELIVIDEIGKLELEEKGWHNSLLQIVSHSKSHLLLSVREDVLNEVLVKYRISPEIIFNVSEQNGDDLFLKIQSDMKSPN
jgi:nucleoside-triphosphatase THEP1